MEDNNFFTVDELGVMKNRSFMEIKAAADPKITQLLTQVKNELQSEIKRTAMELPHGINQTSGKISRGENYHGFAYRLIDFPSALSGEDVFLFRTLFLWGHHFSIHFILRGSWLEQFKEKILGNWNAIGPLPLLVCQEDSPWEWELGSEAYAPISEVGEAELSELLDNSGFLKLSLQVPISGHSNLSREAVLFWQQIELLLFT